MARPISCSSSCKEETLYTYTFLCSHLMWIQCALFAKSSFILYRFASEKCERERGRETLAKFRDFIPRCCFYFALSLKTKKIVRCIIIVYVVVIHTKARPYGLLSNTHTPKHVISYVYHIDHGHHTALVLKYIYTQIKLQSVSQYVQREQEQKGMRSEKKWKKKWDLKR